MYRERFTNVFFSSYSTKLTRYDNRNNLEFDVGFIIYSWSHNASETMQYLSSICFQSAGTYRYHVSSREEQNKNQSHSRWDKFILDFYTITCMLFNANLSEDFFSFESNLKIEPIRIQQGKIFKKVTKLRRNFLCFHEMEETTWRMIENYMICLYLVWYIQAWIF